MASNSVDEINEKQFDEKISKKIVLVDFFAEWCMPCLMMSPIIEEMADYFRGKIEFAKVNIDDNQKLAGRFNVMSIPTLIIFKDGKEADRIVGAVQAEQLEEKLKKYSH